jgi:hypothetical protein
MDAETHQQLLRLTRDPSFLPRFLCIALDPCIEPSIRVVAIGASKSLAAIAYSSGRAKTEINMLVRKIMESISSEHSLVVLILGLP